MTQSVYVLVRVKPTQEGAVGDHLRSLKAADEVHPLFGEFDFIVKIKGASHESIAQTILREIRTHPGVASTKTLVKTAF